MEQATRGTRMWTGSPRRRGLCTTALSVVLIGAVAASAAAGPAGGGAGEPESITLSPGATATTKTVFTQSDKYTVQATGAVTEVFPKQGDQQMTCVTDAFYQECKGGPNPGSPSRFSGITVNSKFASGAGLERYSSGGLPPFNSGHSYTLTLDRADPGTFDLRAAAGANPGPGTEVTGSFKVTITPPSTKLTVALSDITRKVEVQRGGGAWEVATAALELKEGDKVHTGFKAGVTLTFPDRSTVRLQPMTFLAIDKLSLDGDVLKARLVLKSGEIKATVQRLPGTHGDFEVKTPTTTASIRGTKFSVLYDGIATTVAVTESSVLVTANSGANVVVPAGMQTRSTARGVSELVKVGQGEKRGGLTAAKALTHLTAKLAKKLTACKFDAVSIRLAPAKGGWRGSFVIVPAGQGIDDKPTGTAKFRLKGKTVNATNALGKKIARGCR